MGGFCLLVELYWERSAPAACTAGWCVVCFIDFANIHCDFLIVFLFNLINALFLFYIDFHPVDRIIVACQSTLHNFGDVIFILGGPSTVSHIFTLNFVLIVQEYLKSTSNKSLHFAESLKFAIIQSHDCSKCQRIYPTGTYCVYLSLF